jgi:hypothetical protein
MIDITLTAHSTYRPEQWWLWIRRCVRIERGVEFGRRHWQQRAAVDVYSDLLRISAGQRIVQLIGSAVNRKARHCGRPGSEMWKSPVEGVCATKISGKGARTLQGFLARLRTHASGAALHLLLVSSARTDKPPRMGKLGGRIF